MLQSIQQFKLKCYIVFFLNSTMDLDVKKYIKHIYTNAIYHAKKVEKCTLTVLEFEVGKCVRTLYTGYIQESELNSLSFKTFN